MNGAVDLRSLDLIIRNWRTKGRSLCLMPVHCVSYAAHTSRPGRLGFMASAEDPGRNLNPGYNTQQ